MIEDLVVASKRNNELLIRSTLKRVIPEYTPIGESTNGHSGNGASVELRQITAQQG
jgi:hypothetical protein